MWKLKSSTSVNHRGLQSCGSMAAIDWPSAIVRALSVSVVAVVAWVP